MSTREINLLPPSRRYWLQQQVTSLALIRFLNTIIGATSVLTAAALLILLIGWIGNRAIAPQEEASIESVVTEYGHIRERIAEQNNLLRYVATFGHQRIVWSEFLRSFFDVLPPDVTIATLRAQGVLEPGAGTVSSLSVTGNTTARSTLTIMQDRLQTLPAVASVTAPATNLIKRDNPPYQFTLELKDRHENTD